MLHLPTQPYALNFLPLNWDIITYENKIAKMNKHIQCISFTLIVGNEDIIRILRQSGQNPTELNIEISIKAHKPHFYDWLI